LKNAWVDEDAYITFRTVEQLFAGNGLRWNPHERVQAYTHPLWLGVLAAMRLFTTDLFIASIVASLGLCAVALERLYRATGSPARWGLALAILIASRSFFDFTTSGLEGALSYALLGAFFVLFFHAATREPTPASRDLAWLSLASAALLLTRHDHATLIAAPYLLIVARAWPIGPRRCLKAILLGGLPFLLWTAFSLFYYGIPIPNTALAKLGAGIPAGQLAMQGLRYLASTTRFDPVFPLAIAAALTIAIAGLRSRIDRRERDARLAVAAGIVTQLVYVVWAGGDYMAGRFVSATVFTAALLVGRSAPDRVADARFAAVGALALALLMSSAPLRSGPGYVNETVDAAGVGDQRGIFFPYTSIHAWWRHDPTEPFPDHRWTHEALKLARSKQRVFLRANIGFMGYWIGVDKIIVDRLGLSDPLLARLPAIPLWRIGHFPREVPVGYLESLESIETSESRIEDAGVRALHEHLRLVTEADLMATGRLETIVGLNLGRYDASLR
jgi:arabinofuranosyltransferase